ncbi:uncharacterized protein F5Z01DRAFT_687587 [Emericellopsis atlantica]|uniref:Uncharacterized protein n=1 Tax=Emericellopsis atlantica TaxID=2614577 RepID=A0A9P8CNS3_9HYPO|nr:uncharacterized protein F5Z01DRAFT_687587 [Emericellopsis atlantica]KAG9254084.1 hypothetical protein F5Z01DRAFT_687587 [Emericellopsis atlantica]
MSSSYITFVSVGLSAVIAIPIAVTGILTCLKARRGGDPARRGFTWLKLAYSFIFTGYVFSIVADLINGLMYYGVASNQPHVTNALIVTGSVIAWLGEVCVILTCTELGCGFTYALRLERTPSHKIWRLYGVVSGAILAILAIVSGAYNGWAYAQYLDSVYYSSAYEAVERSNKLSAALSVLAFFVSAGLIVQASLVRRKYLSNMPAANVSHGWTSGMYTYAAHANLCAFQSVTLYLVATILFVVPRRLWAMVTNLVYVTRGFTELNEPTVGVTTWLVISGIPQLILLILLFVVGLRKSDGLWTTMQPWMHHTAPNMASMPPTTQQQPQTYYGTPADGNAYMPTQMGQSYAVPGQQDYAQHYGYYTSPAGQWQQPQEAPGAPVQAPSEVPAEPSRTMYSQSGSSHAPHIQQDQHAQVQSSVAYEKP